jgi:predicted transcriptional regulator
VTIAALVLPATATAGYITKPATEDYSNELYDFEEDAFLDQPPQVMISYIMLMLLPACFFPGEILYLLSTLVPLGFRRVTKRTILDDGFRFDLYRQIAAHPGTGPDELGELTGVSRGRIRYHLAMLIREGKVAALEYRNRTGHFARNQRHTDLEQHILICLQDEPSRAKLEFLLRSPDTTRSNLAEQFGLSGPAVSRQMQELEAKGIVVTERDGRFVRYGLSESAREFLNRHPEDLLTSGHPDTEGQPSARGPEVLSG